MGRRGALQRMTGAALAGTAAAIGLGAGGAQAAGRVSIVGSWRLALEFTTTQRSSVQEPQYATLTADGGYVQTGTPPQVSSGHGAWSQVGRDMYEVTAELLRYPSGPEGPRLTQRIVGRVQLAPDGDTFSGSFRLEVRLPNGTVADSGTGTVQGTRIVTEPFEA
jgi:hypothetical protein